MMIENIDFRAQDGMTYLLITVVLVESNHENIL